jgi:GMP synthase-like glutamine amidotransferase
MSGIKLAILDLYDNTPNLGLKNIREIIEQFDCIGTVDIFDVRAKAEVPSLDYDIYISTGGPGSPLDGDGHWEVQYFDWMQSVWDWNQVEGNRRKHVFFICHSFQMACHHFKVGAILPRRSPSFGIYPVHMTDLGVSDPLFEGLNNPFYAADFRNWQVVQPDVEHIEAMGFEILALEKARPHIPLERAIMAVRFSDEIVGVQFHPEADPDGMRTHFLDPKRRALIFQNHSERKYLNMMDHLFDSDNIELTHAIVLPYFLHRTIQKIQKDLTYDPCNSQSV